MTAGPTKKELEIILRVKNEATKEIVRVGADAKAMGEEAMRGAKGASDSFVAWETAASETATEIKRIGADAEVAAAKAVDGAQDATDLFVEWERAAAETAEKIRTVGKDSETAGAKAMVGARDASDSFRQWEGSAAKTTTAVKSTGDGAKVTGDKAKKTGKEATASFLSWEGSAKKVGAAIKSLVNPLSLIGGALGLGTIIALGKGMSEAADQADAIAAKFDIAFGTRAVSYGKNVEVFASQVGRSRTELKSMAADMQLVTTQLLGSEDVALKVTDAFVRLAVDVGEVANVSEGDVMRKFIDSIQGSGDALKGLAAAIKPAEVDAKALALGLAATTLELTEQDRSVARISLAFDRFRDQQGGAERGSQRFGSRMRELAAVAKEVREEFGQRLNAAIVKGLDDAGGAKAVRELVTVFNAAIAEFAGIGVTVAAQLARAAAEALEGFGGADGVVRWLQDRGNVLVAQLRLFGAEFALMAVSFGQAVERMVEKLRPALERLGAVPRGDASREDLIAERAEAAKRFQSGFFAGGPLGFLETSRAATRLKEIDAELARMERLAELDEARVRAREQLAAVQAQIAAGNAPVPSADPANPANWQGADFSGLHEMIAAATRLDAQMGDTALAVMDAQTAMAGIGKDAETTAPQIQAMRDAIVGLSPEAEATAVKLTGMFVEFVAEVARDLEIKRRMAKAAADAAEFADRQINGMTDAILATATGAIKAKDALKQFIQSMVQDLLRAQVQAGVKTLLGDSFTSLFGSVNPAANGAVFAGGLGTAVPVKGYAMGGPIVRSPHLALIGEGRYNEAVVPLPDGRSIPVRMQGGDGGGMNVSVALTVNALDGRSAVQVLSQDLDGLGTLVANAIATNRDLNATVRGRST